MTRLTHVWAAMSRERRIAAISAIALLVTMFLPWYGLQSLNPKTKAIYSHNINAFGDVSFVEAAVFLVAAGVLVLLFARAEDREFNMPGGDGAVIAVAGGWAAVLIFYRVFDRPDGHGYPVGIQWGFFLAFVAAGSLAYAGWRIRAGERPAMPVRRRRAQPDDPPFEESEEQERVPRNAAAGREPVPARSSRSAPAASPGTGEPTGETAQIGVAAGRSAGLPPAPAGAPAKARPRRPRYPPAPDEPEQLSFEDHPPGEEG
jgi:hypothetical protein